MYALENSAKDKNVVYLVQMLKLSIVEGQLDMKQVIVLERLAKKLDIPGKEFQSTLGNLEQYENGLLKTLDQKLRFVFNSFKLIFGEERLDEMEYELVLKGIYKLGFNNSQTVRLIKKSFKIFGKGINFLVYKKLIMNSVLHYSTKRQSNLRISYKKVHSY